MKKPGKKTDLADLKNIALADLWCGPPQGAELLSQKDLFDHLREAGGDWPIDAMADAMTDIMYSDAFQSKYQVAVSNDKTVSKDTLDAWRLRGSRPGYFYRLVLEELLLERGGEFAQAWIEVFNQHWMRGFTEKTEAGNKRAREEALIRDIQDICLCDPRLTFLPALFDTDQPLPLATAYVDLSVTEAPPVAASLRLLHRPVSLAEKIRTRIEQRYASRNSPKDLLDLQAPQSTLLLGDPGAGKSSLMKRIARDIAEGKWKSARVPLFVEARAYWAWRGSNPGGSLIDYALEPIARRTSVEAGQLCDLLFNYRDNKTSAVLLVDGLDEIATSDEAVDLVYGQLNEMRAPLRWIASSRPAGLVASPGETFRCELVELDEEAIEAIVENWCGSLNAQDFPVSADQLMQEVLGSASNQEMARNPFLLTAMCFLKAQAPDQDLPRTRVAVYSELMECIGIQARRTTRRRDVLTSRHVRTLEAFCFDLYDSKQVRQIFSRDDWEGFIQSGNAEPVDFDRCIAPARLLTSWDVGVERFHFSHLSLQEFLVARAMLGHSAEFALSKRFHPAWRAVFRFYGALLRSSGREDDFRALVCEIYETRDYTGYTMLTLAEIFSDCGIRNTTKWLGEDLRDTLLENSSIAQDTAGEAMIDALVLLDPNWLAQRAADMLAHRHEVVEGISDDEEFPVDGKSVESPYQLLARTRTPAACALVLDTFFGSDNYEARCAAEAAALIATGKIRKRATDKIIGDPAEPGFFFPFIDLTDCNRRSEFVPALSRIVTWCNENGEGSSEVCDAALAAMSLIGGDDALTVLTEKLRSCLSAGDADPEQVGRYIHLIAQAGGAAALERLEAARELTTDPEVLQLLDLGAIHANPYDPDRVRNVFQSGATKLECVASLARAAEMGRLVGEDICAIVRDAYETDPEVDLMDLALFEEARVRGGQKPYLCDAILKGAEDAFEQFGLATDEDEKEVHLENFMVSMDALEFADWQPTGAFVRDLIFAPDVNPNFLHLAIRVAGSLFRGQGDQDLLARLLHLWFAAPEDNAPFASTAVGRINLDTLFRFQSAYWADEALAELGAEGDLLLFDAYYTDKRGDKHFWDSPPLPVLFLIPGEDQPEAGNLAHSLSRYGVCTVEKETPGCLAAIISPENGSFDWCREEVEAFRSGQSRQGPGASAMAGQDRPVFHIPEGFNYSEADDFADRIAGQLGLTPLVE